uniref:Uncharacterized protein n=1 Tax=Arundo donax TaxID=35708 RepID=A0A0A9BL79_ARUDO
MFLQQKNSQEVLTKKRREKEYINLC